MNGDRVLRLADPSALRCNTRGELAPQQRAVLLRWLLADTWRGGAGLLAMGVVAIACTLGAREVLGLDGQGLRLVFSGTSLVGGALVLSRWGRRALRLLRDLWRGEVASGWGRLGWFGGRWAVELDAPRALLAWHPAQRTLEVPLPGRARVYWLPSAGFVMGLDFAISEGVRSTSEARSALADLLRLAPGALASWRAGQLGLAGRRRLLAMVVWRVLGVLAIVAVLLVDTPRLWAEPMWMLVVLVASGGAIVLLGTQAQRLWADVREGGVLRVQGLVRVEDGPGSGRFFGGRRVRVHGERPQTLWIRPRWIAGLVAELEYAVYYTPRAQAVLALEPLDDFR